MMNKIIGICLLLCITFASLAQVDYSRQYNNAKDLFKNKKYNLAMESFKPLVSYDQNNPYSAYASFYYALSAYHQNYKAVAKDQLNQIIKLYKDWDKLSDVYLWLAKIHFENRDLFQALKTLSNIKDKNLQADIEAMKKQYVNTVTDAETLRMMLEEYPKDEVIAKALAVLLSKNPSDVESKKQLEALITKFNFNRSELIPEAPDTFHKDRYSVAVMLPFMVNSLTPTTSKKPNQIILDFYQGMELALDTLNKQGINVELHAYDTERNIDKIKKLLNTNEMKSTDLIIGPLFPEENKVAQEFSLNNKINIIHPFGNSSELITNNPHAFLFQPSSETLGRKSAEYLAQKTRRKNTMVFYGPNKKDSVMMANFVQTAKEKGLRVVFAEKINSKEASRIINIIAKPTEFDEFKYPSQFTIKKDSIGSIFVASDDALIYSKIVSGVETRGDSIKIVGSENWIDDTAVDLEKYETLKIVLTAPNFASHNKGQYKDFEKKYLKVHRVYPSTMAAIGYELMMFAGTQLKKNGVYFQDGLSKEQFIPGYLFEGFNYNTSHDNQLVPFISFRKGEISLVDKR